MNITKVVSPSGKSAITGSIISALPDWFADEESNQMYIREVAERDT